MATDSQDPPAVVTSRKRASGFWRQLRRLLVFQFKLYVDALRDFLLSLLSFGAFLLDVVHRQDGSESHFDQVLKLGRPTERAINLFDQHAPEEQDKHSLDGLIREVEERVRKDRSQPTGKANEK